MIYGDPGAVQEAVVTAFDWDAKTVSLNTMLTIAVGDNFRFRLSRVKAYDEGSNESKYQDGLTRFLDDFEWKLLPDEAGNKTITQGHHLMTEILQKKRRELKRKLNEDNSPYAGFIDDDDKRAKK